MKVMEATEVTENSTEFGTVTTGLAKATKGTENSATVAKAITKAAEEGHRGHGKSKQVRGGHHHGHGGS